MVGGDYSKRKYPLTTYGEIYGYIVRLNITEAEQDICNAVRKELLYLPNFLTGGVDNGQTGSSSEGPVLSHA